jgi:type II secretory pathway pseudopilin PulG
MFAAKLHQHPTRNCSGFTYMAALVLLSIVAVAATYAFSIGEAAHRRDLEMELIYVGKQYQLALRRYAAVTPPGYSRHPRSLDDLLLDSRLPGTVRHIRQLYPDPITRQSDWLVHRNSIGEVVAISSRSTLAPIKTSGFDTESSGFENAASYQDWVFGVNPAPTQRR